MSAVIKPIQSSNGTRSYSPARQRIFDMIDHADTFGKSDEELIPAQIAAAQEYFEELRPKVRILDKRAQETGIEKITKMEDLVPLLFSHTTYKTYPVSFVTNGQWDRMTQWLSTLSAQPLDNVNLKGIQDIDDWLIRLQEANHLVATTSGTSGKVSVLNRTPDDTLIGTRITSKFFGWPKPIAPNRDRHFFSLTPSDGAGMLVYHAHIFASLFARPDSIHYLSNERMRVAPLMRAAEMRQKMVAGTAKPEEVEEFQKTAKAQADKMEKAIDGIVDEILAVRHELCFISGLWAMYWRLMEKARARGIPDGDFNPNTLAGAGGGLKGLNLPPDYAEQVFKFLGVQRFAAYGMSEMVFSQPRCEAGRFHREPWIIQLLLDGTGEHLLDMNRTEGVIEGRFAILDMSQHGRWGGIITGDKVEMAFGKCPCGRHGPTILPTITRYANLGEEDKIGCAGTIESYIRGALQ